MLRRSMLHEQLAQRIKHVSRVQSARDTDRKAFPGELVDHAQHHADLAIMGAVLDEVIGPDMTFVRWP